MISSEKPAGKPLDSDQVNRFDQFVKLADYSLMTQLNADPDAQPNGQNHRPREIASGHYVPVTPTPLPEPEYIAHSHTLFNELGLSQTLPKDQSFQRLFTGDLSVAQPPMHPVGWATGYALSIYGTEYQQQCPFGTGNGYGDGRAISVFEGVFQGARWEMQLKGSGPTPYCRGADGRAVLRSSIREFLAQELMQALGVPTSRSLTLYVSQSETVPRPWYGPGSRSWDPDVMVDNPVAISTRVAPSFLRVGQLELFARRVRSNAHPDALKELRMIVTHLIEREYRQEVDATEDFTQQVIQLATLFRQRLTQLVAHWIRVGYCQGNFNSDNCAAGGYTLDYGPFGFCEIFDPEFQPWTGGGHHFAFFNQPKAAEANYHMFWQSLRPLLAEAPEALAQLDDVRRGFSAAMAQQLQTMWATKLGLQAYDAELYESMVELMTLSEVDYTRFFRQLCALPTEVSALKQSFYVKTPKSIKDRWDAWLNRWQALLPSGDQRADLSKQMLQVNPKYTWREWLVVPAYEQAMQGEYTLVQSLQNVLTHPYDEQTPDVAAEYNRMKPKAFYRAGGVSHYSCSS